LIIKCHKSAAPVQSARGGESFILISNKVLLKIIAYCGNIKCKWKRQLKLLSSKVKTFLSVKKGYFARVDSLIHIGR